MKRIGIFIMLTIFVAFPCLATTTINYTYDAQHRLLQASHSDSQKDFYSYDAAGNVDQHVVITDAKYLQSWLLYFSMLGGHAAESFEASALLADSR